MFKDLLNSKRFTYFICRIFDASQVPNDMLNPPFWHTLNAMQYNVSLEIWFCSALKPLLVFDFFLLPFPIFRCVFLSLVPLLWLNRQKNFFLLDLKQKHQTKPLKHVFVHEELCSWNAFNCSTTNMPIKFHTKCTFLTF